MKSLPNILTLARLVLSLLMFFAMAAVGASLSNAAFPVEAAIWLARFSLAAFVIAAVTDFFDGWLARRWNATSLIGAILDPIADKVLVCGAILGLLAVRTPGVLIPGGLILFREFAVSALRETLAPRGLRLPVTSLAKIKTTLQLVAITALMALTFWPTLGLSARVDHLARALEAAQALFALAAAVTLWTGLDYARAAARALRAT